MSREAFSEFEVTIEDMIEEKKTRYAVTCTAGRGTTSWVLIREGKGVEITLVEIEEMLQEPDFSDDGDDVDVIEDDVDKGNEL